MVLRRKYSGLKRGTETAALRYKTSRGRGAFPTGRSRIVKCGGLLGSENVGMSSEKEGENPSHRKPKVS